MGTTAGSASQDWLSEQTCLSERAFTSLETYINQQLREDGRRYHTYREGRYALPNDEIEQQREEIMHLLVMDLLDGRLFLSPMDKEPTKVMDLATGVGLWAIEMGDRYPGAEITGVDLSPIQPTSVPPNVTFQIDDVEDTWIYDKDFDFIHMREASGYMKSTPTVVETSFEHLRPGGWFELQEFHWEAENEDGTLERNPINRYMEGMYSYARTEDREMRVVPKMGDLLRETGFVNIRRDTFRVPYGSFPEDEREKRRGAFFVATCEILLPSSYRHLSTAGMPPDEIRSLFADMRQFWNDNAHHCWATYYVWSAQKPGGQGPGQTPGQGPERRAGQAQNP